MRHSFQKVEIIKADSFINAQWLRFETSWLRPSYFTGSHNCASIAMTSRMRLLKESKQSVLHVVPPPPFLPHRPQYTIASPLPTLALNSAWAWSMHGSNFICCTRFPVKKVSSTVYEITSGRIRYIIYL